MSTLYDRLLRRMDRWNSAIDRERDLCAREMARLGPTEHLVAWMQQLDAEQARHRAAIAKFHSERHNPAVMFPARPRRMLPVLRPTMARASLRAQGRRRA